MRDPRADSARVTSKTQTVASFIVDSLIRAGIEVVFGLPGVHALGLFNAVEKSGLRYIGLRHEHAAAHAADGYGRATGIPGVVLLSTGPGALNALSAIGEAYVSSSPVLAITSAIPSNLVGAEKGFLHEIKDLAPAFASVTRFSGRAQSVEEIPELLAKALTATFSARPGTAMIELPLDFIDAEIDHEPLKPRATIRVVAGDEAAKLENAAWLLSLAARPVIWAGGGVIRSRSSSELLKVAETVDSPVITTFMGKGAIPEDHPLAVGTMVRQPEGAALLQDADLMLAVGTRFSAMSTSNWKMELPSQLIHIDADPQEIGRNYPVRLGIVADAKDALMALAGKVKRRAAEGPSGAERAAMVRDSAFAGAVAEGPREMAILNAVRSALDPSVVTVHDMTVPSYWAWRFFEVSRPGTFHSPYGFGSLGFSLPAAIGVAAANPSSPVVAFCGDGGFQYHDRELATIAEHSLPITVIVFNDRAWGVLKGFSTARYQSTFAMDLPGPDFVMLASAHGIDARRTEDPDELQKILEEAVSSGKPNLIEVPGPWALPPPTEYYR